MSAAIAVVAAGFGGDMPEELATIHLMISITISIR